MTDELEKIRLTGKNDYFTRSGSYSNPYPLHSPEFNAYERGWMQSLKDNGGKLIDQHPPKIPKRAQPKPFG